MPKVINQLSIKNKKLFGNEKYHVNPTGKFVIGGPHGDTGLTGRKIIVDTYGGKGAHGGGAFSGKDPSKVDRSAAYATRHIAKNLVAAGVSEKILVQVSYAIGIADPMGVFIDTFGTSKVNLTDGNIGDGYTSYTLEVKAGQNFYKVMATQDFGETFINFDMLPSDRKTITKLMRENDEIWIEFNHYQDGPRFYKYDTRGFSKLFQTHCKISN